MKRVLITGGAGFIGSNLVQRLSDYGGYDITVLDNESLGCPEFITDRVSSYIKGDICDRDTLDLVLPDKDTIVHLAADTRVMDSIADPGHNFDINVVGTFGLLNKVREYGVRQFINASTGGAIIGEAKPPVHEGMLPRPTAPYGASKLAVEGYCSAFHGSYGLQTASLRFSNIYGPLSFHKGSVVAHFFKRILKNERLVIFGDGSQTRDYLFVGDQVAGIQQTIDQQPEGVFQLGSGKPTSLNELVETMRIVVEDHPFPDVTHKSFRRGELRHTWCDISKAKRVLGFAPETSLIEGLRTTWSWFKANTARFQ